jgi:phosphoesterase RecJ-like protein
MIFTPEKIDLFNQYVKEAKSIVITAHKSPDGDSIGSSLALFHYLKQEHQNVVVCHPDVAPNFLTWIPGFEEIVTHQEKNSEVVNYMVEADLIFCLDYNSPGRIGKMDDLLAKSNAKKIMIDHHRDPDPNLVTLMFSDHNICSTAQLIYELIEARADLSKINQDVSQCIYTGLVTDTGSFRFSSTDARTHQIVAALIENGLKHSAIHEQIFDTNTEDRIKLISYSLLEKLVVLREYETAYISLTKKEQERFNATKGDTEGLVNQALSLAGIKVAVFFKESDGIIKISFRSIGKIPVNDLARNNFQGGGHLNAAGGKHVGKMEDALSRFVTILPNFVQENKSTFE